MMPESAAQEIPKSVDLDRLKRLRKKRRWRAVIALGNRMLTEVAPDSSLRIHTELGKAWIEVRQYDAARSHLQSAQTLRPDHPTVLRRFGELESVLGNFEAAAEYWLSLKKKKAQRADSVIFLNLARAQRHLGDWQAAMLTANEGYRRYPRSQVLKYELLRIQSMIEDRVEIDGSFSKSKSADRDHPYRDLDSANFWRQTVSAKNSLDIDNWYRRKFSIAGLSISSAGSCFAQHIGRALRENGYEYIDTEPAPNFLRPESRQDYGYGIYSARFGNVYTSRQLLQLLQRALHLFESADSIWERDGGYVDALRPTVEPDPFEHPEQVIKSRQWHLAAVERMFKLSDLFVFTMGLTETWISNEDGTAFPVAPGVQGGRYDPRRYAFKNLSYPEVLDDMEEFIRLVRGINPRLRIILTVSPVPLMATASTENVVVATSYSKSVLRSVAGYLKNQYEFIDYFPSYEIIGSHPMRGQFFEPDGRGVSLSGVAHVMKQFFSQHVPPAIGQPEAKTEAESKDPEDLVCEEELLAEFGTS